MYNPLKKQNLELNFQTKTIKDLLSFFGYRAEFDWEAQNELSGGKRRSKLFKIDLDILTCGEPIQRKYEWSLNEQQALIDTIYEDGYIGVFVYNRLNISDVLENLRKDDGGISFWMELIDGKQRLLTIIKFLKNEFCDRNGFFWKDLSEDAQSTFLQRKSLHIAEFENISELEKCGAFIKLNRGGKKVSDIDIERVQALIKKLECDDRKGNL